MLLDVQDLTTYYEVERGFVKAAEEVSFYVNRGEAFGLAGESGCGKTTVALSLMRLLPPNGRIVKGRILLDGEDLVRKSEEEMRRIRWKRISIVFQGAMNALNPVFTVGSQIVEAILTHENVSKEEAWSRARKLFDMVGLDPSRLREYPHEFSGGMRQRAMIAMALACNPDLIIADEPTTALDVITQAQVLRAIDELRHKLNLSMILISHDLATIADTCDRVAIMYAGKIVEYGDIVSVFKHTLHPYSQKLIAAFPSILGEKRPLSTIHGFPPDLLNPPPGCRFHPRCPYASERCRREEPKLVEARKEHYVACHLVGG